MSPKTRVPRIREGRRLAVLVPLRPKINHSSATRRQMLPKNPRRARSARTFAFVQYEDQLFRSSSSSCTQVHLVSRATRHRDYNFLGLDALAQLAGLLVDRIMTKVLGSNDLTFRLTISLLQVGLILPNVSKRRQFSPSISHQNCSHVAMCCAPSVCEQCAHVVK